MSAISRHLMFMYEGIVGPLSGTVVDKLAESETLSEREVADLRHDLAPLLAIVRNEDTDNFLEAPRSPPKPQTTSKGVQCAPSSEDLLSSLTKTVSDLKSRAPLDATQPLVEL